ncbi:transcriptional regulator SplA domain-containing protein [Thalassobacillus pellis]|uniref:transcriptional regulator SplA domain-containing protein n=1 Tax=Thalassobacillus pellis TaxID=748008 RepID=UPI001960648D|nr:transcriptional regulator SplA domain-containing protein [Thalassobacillus pellis]MBM7552553.1 transcriptional regulator of the spore photoproduct lyase operon [Thalassobacillus pellis]
MDNMVDPTEVNIGDEVYVIYRNPHTPTVANIKQAEVVPHPHQPDNKALFLHDSFHLIEENDALFSNQQEAQAFFNEMFQD